jgi:hypothetical protein
MGFATFFPSLSIEVETIKDAIHFYHSGVAAGRARGKLHEAVPVSTRVPALAFSAERRHLLALLRLRIPAAPSIRAGPTAMGTSLRVRVVSPFPNDGEGHDALIRAGGCK